jgi:hypothetical protein
VQLVRAAQEICCQAVLAAPHQVSGMVQPLGFWRLPTVVLMASTISGRTASSCYTGEGKGAKEKAGG